MQSLSNQEQDLFPHNKASPSGKPNPFPSPPFFFTPADFDLFGFANFVKKYHEPQPETKVKTHYGRRVTL